jgi:hypothetical protein
LSIFDVDLQANIPTADARLILGLERQTAVFWKGHNVSLKVLYSVLSYYSNGSICSCISVIAQFLQNFALQNFHVSICMQMSG